MNKIAVLPGSFDPFTIGHQSLVNQALPLFDKIIIAIGRNSEKDNHLFPITKRINWIRNVYHDNPKIEVETYKDLTVKFCEFKKANFIIRGLRNGDDFKFEKDIAQMNNKINSGNNPIAGAIINKIRVVHKDELENRN